MTKTKTIVWRLWMFALALFILAAIPSTKTQAAYRTGTYRKHYTSTISRRKSESYKTVIINKITKNRVALQVLYSCSYPARVSQTAKVIGVRKGNQITFKYKESYFNIPGKGTIKLYKNYIKIRTTGKGYLSTGGKWVKLKRVSSKKKIRPLY